jgi:hypothetical protein
MGKKKKKWQILYTVPVKCSVTDPNRTASFFLAGTGTRAASKCIHF